jgi:2-dehydro-3-deoxyphosphooctonate aldolase (KDO 8-P synthase)
MVRIIAGPCQHESLEQSLEIAKECKRVCDLYEFNYYFKASFDKANRTHINSTRGIGPNPWESFFKTLKDFKKIKKTLDVKILTDIHERWQIGDIVRNGSVDVVQIPAFLCRQTDLITAVAQMDIDAINIKKGQFMAPWDIDGILSKTQDRKAKEVWITERGTSFGYNTLVNDFTGIKYMLDNAGVPVVFDVTHSVQKPGGQGNSSGGNRSYVPSLSRAAAAMGVDNFFLEVHPDPDNAPSDGPNMLKLEDFAETIRQIYFINKTIKGF